MYQTYGDRPRIYSGNENSSCRLTLKVEVINNGSVVYSYTQAYDYSYVEGGPIGPGAILGPGIVDLEKGTVKLRLTAEIIYVSYFGAGTSFKIWHLLSGNLYGSVANVNLTHYLKRTEIGGNGLYSFWDLTKYLYYSATEGLLKAQRL